VYLDGVQVGGVATSVPSHLAVAVPFGHALAPPPLARAFTFEYRYYPDSLTDDDFSTVQAGLLAYYGL
jgi:hypothetical protein